MRRKGSYGPSVEHKTGQLANIGPYMAPRTTMGSEHCVFFLPVTWPLATGFRRLSRTFSMLQSVRLLPFRAAILEHCGNTADFFFYFIIRLLIILFTSSGPAAWTARRVRNAQLRTRQMGTLHTCSSSRSSGIHRRGLGSCTGKGSGGKSLL